MPLPPSRTSAQPAVRSLSGLVFLLLLLALVACRKDRLDAPSAPAPANAPAPESLAANYPISVAEAMVWFARIRGAAATDAGFNDAGDGRFIALEPDWSGASAGQSLSGREVVVVPLPDSAMQARHNGRAGAKLQFSKAGPDSITADLVVYVADSAYWADTGGIPDFHSFSGAYVYYDLGQNFRYALRVDSGAVVAATDTLNVADGGASDRLDCFAYDVS